MSNRDHSLPEDYASDAPLLERLRSWSRAIEANYGWYEISSNAAANLRADLDAAIAALAPPPPLETKEIET